MKQVVNGPVAALRAAIGGQVTGPADPGYDQARRVWNAGVDRRPAVIAGCASPGDVATAVRFAAEHYLEVTVRGGAHGMSGASVAEDGLMVDLSRLSRVSVDPQTKRARAGGGTLLAELDTAAQAHGLAVPSGLVSHTGIGGLALGGGMGWLTRQAGLSIDNLLSAQVVTADGRTLRASGEEHPDLFWAIRGGGGNFGVVTEFEFALHEAGPVVQVGLLFWGLDDGPAVLRMARELVPGLPRELNILIAGLNAPPAPFVPAQHHHRPGYALVIAGFGTSGQHERVISRIRRDLPPLWEFATPMPYTGLQQMLDEANAWGRYGYDKGLYLEDLSDDAIDVIAARLPRQKSPLSAMLFYRLDQAYSEAGEDDTAFSGGRSPRYAAFIIGLCPTGELLAAEREWARSSWQALRPYSLGTWSYVNAMTDTGEDHVRASYGPARYQRLVDIKRDYYPQNLFHHNANIRPA